MLIYCPGWSRDLGMQLSFVAVYAILLGIELLKVSNIRHPIALYLAVPVAAQLGTGFIAWPTFGVFPKFFLLQHRGLAPDGVAGNCTRWHRGSRPRLGLASGCAHRKLGCRWRIESTVDLVGVIAFTCMDLEPARRGWRIAHGVEFGMACRRNPRLSLRRFLWACCAVGLALIPWIGWQAHHRIAVGFRYGLVIDGASSMAASMVTHARDSARLVVQKATIGADNGSHAVLLSNPLAKHAADTWAISPSRNAGFGQIKSRPFA